MKLQAAVQICAASSLALSSPSSDPRNRLTGLQQCMSRIIRSRVMLTQQTHTVERKASRIMRQLCSTSLFHLVPQEKQNKLFHDLVAFPEF